MTSVTSDNEHPSFDVDLTAFMNVVKLLTCRLCSFKTICKDEFLRHVKDEHITAQEAPSNSFNESLADLPNEGKNESTSSTLAINSNDVGSKNFQSETDQLSSSRETLPSLLVVHEPSVATSAASAGINQPLVKQNGLINASSIPPDEEPGYTLDHEEPIEDQQGSKLLSMTNEEAPEAGMGALNNSGVVQLTSEQFQQMVKTTKASTGDSMIAASMLSDSDNRVSLVPVSNGSLSPLTQQFAIISDDVHIFTLTSTGTQADVPTSLVCGTPIQSVQAVNLPRVVVGDDGMPVTLTTLNNLTGLVPGAIDGMSLSAVTTKEILSCGNCKISFESKEEFMLHVKENHPQSNLSAVAAMLQDGDSVDASPRVNVDMPIQRKRPGRKKKSLIGIKEEAGESADDEDWRPGISERPHGRHKRTSTEIKDAYNPEKRKLRKTRHEKLAVSEEYTLRCSAMACVARFRTQSALDIHTSCHNNYDQQFTCISCQTIFPYWKHLRLHLWREHQIDCDLFQCPTCDFKTDTCHKLSVHAEIHSDNRPYTCDICGKGFKQFSQMRNHQIIHEEHHSSDPTKWYSAKDCYICKRKFANSKCLKKHVQAVHSDVKPYSCPHCPHRAARKAMMELHIRTHTGDKPFKCDMCTYATGDHNSLRRHKMRHTGQRQYKCPLCSYSCIQTISLKAHIEGKHPGQGGVYTCSLCTFRTVNQQTFHNHQLDHENGIISPNPSPRPSLIHTAALPVMLKQAAQHPDTMVVVAAEENQVTEVIEVPEAMQLQLSVTMKQDGTTTVPDHEYRRLVEYEQVLEHSAQNLLQYAISAITATASASAALPYPRTASMQLAGGTIQATITSSETRDGTNHMITFTMLNTAPVLEGVDETPLIDESAEEQRQPDGYDSPTDSQENDQDLLNEEYGKHPESESVKSS